MTPQEAITELKSLESALDGYCELNETGKIVFRMAIEALEDKIPRKIKKETTDVRTYYCVSCPKCNKHFGYRGKYNIWIGKTPFYCNNCGQMLDWSDVDDNIPT